MIYTYRRDILNQVEEAQKIEQEAVQRAQAYEEKFTNLQQELLTIRESLIRADQKDGERILIEAKEKAARMQKEAVIRFEQQQKQIQEELLHQTLPLR